jgi:diacylglycerol kinase
MIKKAINRLNHALSGIWFALSKDRGFRSQIYLGVGLIFFISTIKVSLSQLELLFIILAYILVLITELQNSALESALNKIHPNIDDNIKHSKDMAAGAVLLAGAFLLLVLVLAWAN